MEQTNQTTELPRDPILLIQEAIRLAQELQTKRISSEDLIKPIGDKGLDKVKELILNIGFHPGVCTKPNCNRYGRNKTFAFVERMYEGNDKLEGVVINAHLKTRCSACKTKAKFILFPEHYERNGTPVWLAIWLIMYGFPKYKDY